MALYIEIENGWAPLFRREEKKEYFQKLLKFLKQEYQKTTIYPEKQNIFNAFKLTDLNDVKVVILGQDPYHEKGQAQGLSFSVPTGFKLPPSLVNIYKELETDLGKKSITNGDLTPWAKQGVMLLNTVLTVEEHKANSHKNLGWLNFTLEVIKELSQKGGVVFVLWGANAISYKKYINTETNCIISSPHPSPLSAYQGFFGSKPFSKVNACLEQMHKCPIEW